MLSNRRNQPRHRTGRSRLTFALYLNAAAMVLIALALFCRSGATSRLPGMLSTALAQNQLPIGGGAGVFIVPAQFNSNNFGCYIMDVDAQTLCAYQYFPAEKNLRLVAARSFKYDRHLGNFNTTMPPSEVKDLV